ncbi:MAG TPA: hypothetical protein VIV11_19385 [Kofleriaceae bacterium]
MRDAVRRYRSRWLCCSIIAVGIAVGVLYGTRLVPAWGHWYSSHTGYREQVDAMLDGSLALYTDPRRLSWDRVWADGEVHQVWGLGVPLWRLPFDGVARLFGQPAFPDRIVLGIAFALVAFALLRYLTAAVPTAVGRRGWSFVEVATCGFALLLFPPLLAMCQSRFLVYEEAQTYAYLVAIALLVGTAHVLRSPTRTGYAVLGLCAGLVGLVRPTALVYGAASVLVSWLFVRRLRWRWWQTWSAIALFALGVAVLLVTNHVRFGTPFEFGHRLNINGITLMMFETRLGNPLDDAPLGALVQDLAGFLFLSRDVPFTRHSYEIGWFPGQISTVRSHEHYFSVYDASFLVLILASWTWCLVRAWRGRKVATPPTPGRLPPALALWSLASASILFVFYLRFPVLSSRYMLDFGPAFAAAIAILACELVAVLRSRGKHRYLVLVALVAWWSYETITARVTKLRRRTPPITQSALVQRMDQAREQLPEHEAIPDEYVVGTKLKRYGIVHNGAGWRPATGEAEVAVQFFVRNPDCLLLEVAAKDPDAPTPPAWRQVRAKIGLESLELEASWGTATGHTLLFRGPRNPSHQTGVQSLFVALVDPRELDDAGAVRGTEEVRYERASVFRSVPSQLRVLRVSWRCTPGTRAAALR